MLFYGIGLDRVKQLMLSSVADLRGRFPLNPSLALRFELMKRCNPENANIRHYLSRTLLTEQLSNSRTVLGHYSAYCSKLLTLLGVLRPKDGEVVGLAGVIAHLSWLDPVPLALVYGLSNGLFDSVMGNPEQLLLFLASIIMVQPVHDSQIQRMTSKGGSCRVVQEVPKEVLAMLQNYNKLVLDTFVNYCREISTPQSCCLPLSKIQIGTEKEATVESACSLFACSSGVTNKDLTTADAFIKYCRGDLSLDHSCVPVVKGFERINSYVLDFFRNESDNVNLIIKENELPSAWHLLHGFSLAVRAVGVAVTTAVQEKELEGNLFVMLQDDQKIEDDNEETNQKQLVRALMEIGNQFKRRIERTWL